MKAHVLQCLDRGDDQMPLGIDFMHLLKLERTSLLYLVGHNVSQEAWLRGCSDDNTSLDIEGIGSGDEKGPEYLLLGGSRPSCRC